jgi:type II secretory pathway pseudopilin PulG
MKNNRGFTIIEMIIGGAVLLIVLMIAMSFFIHQSKYGGRLMKETGVRESVSSALNMIKRDIMQAGSGLVNQDLADSPKTALSLLLDDVDTSVSTEKYYKKLYMSYGGYLTTVLPQPSGTMQTNSDYVNASNVYYVFGVEGYKNGPIFGSTGASINQFRIKAFPQDIGCVLTYATTTPSVNAVSVSGAYDTTTQTTLFTIKSSTALPFTPAISYELITKDTIPAPTPALADVNFPELRRNGVSILGGPKERTMKLSPTGFRIRCQFIASDGTTTWVPQDANFSAQTFANLRLVEVQIRYRMSKSSKEAEGAPTEADKQAGWSQEIVKTINISPRDLVLATYR